MESRNSRIIRALKESRVSQEKLGLLLGVTSQAVGERLRKNEDVDSIQFIAAVSALTGFCSEWLFTGNGPMKKEENLILREDGVAYETTKSEIQSLREENKRLREALSKINEIMKSLITKR